MMETGGMLCCGGIVSFCSREDGLPDFVILGATFALFTPLFGGFWGRGGTLCSLSGRCRKSQGVYS